MQNTADVADSPPGETKLSITPYLLFIYFSAVPALFFYLPGQYEEAVATLVFACALAVAWLAISYLMEFVPINPVITKVLSTLFHTLFVTMGVLHLTVYLYFHQEVTVNTYFILFETNLNEVTETVAMYFDHRSIYLALFVGLPFIAREIAGRMSGTPDTLKFLAVALVVLMLVHVTGLTDSLRLKHNPVTLFLAAIIQYQEEIESYRRITAEQDAGTDIQSISKAERNLYVLVMGESTSRNHMSLYDYDRNTNPRLTELADELHVFTDVVSPHSHTIPVFKKALFLREGEPSEDWADAQTLISLFKDAGFKTIWLSNQEQFSVYGNVVDSIASQADVRIYTGDSAEEKSVSYDEKLLPILDDVLTEDTSPNKFILIHLIGTHAAYDRRYPPAYDQFDAASVAAKGRDFLNTDRNAQISFYDNAVLYNDHIVAEIIERIRRQEQNGYVLYLSDHGEEVFEQRNFAGHVNGSLKLTPFDLIPAVQN